MTTDTVPYRPVHPDAELVCECESEWWCDCDFVPDRSARRRRPPRQRVGPSTVYSLRLDHDVLAALERRAEQLGMAPSALARALIRVGVTGGGPSGEPTDVAALFDIFLRIDSVMGGLRPRIG